MRCGAFPPYCRLCAPVEEIQLFARASSKQGKTNRLRLSLETSLTKLIQTRVPTRCIANQIRVPYSSSWITSYNNCGSSRQNEGNHNPKELVKRSVARSTPALVQLQSAHFARSSCLDGRDP
jgi:hypothetical protein